MATIPCSGERGEDERRERSFSKDRNAHIAARERENPGYYDIIATDR